MWWYEYLKCSHSCIITCLIPSLLWLVDVEGRASSMYKVSHQQVVFLGDILGTESNLEWVVLMWKTRRVSKLKVVVVGLYVYNLSLCLSVSLSLCLCVSLCVCACVSLSLTVYFNRHFPGGSGLAGARMSPFWISVELRVMEVVVTTGAIRRAKLQSKCHHQQTPHCLQARCPSCRPTIFITTNICTHVCGNKNGSKIMSVVMWDYSDMLGDDNQPRCGLQWLWVTDRCASG